MMSTNACKVSLSLTSCKPAELRACGEIWDVHGLARGAPAGIHCPSQGTETDQLRLTHYHIPSMTAQVRRSMKMWHWC